MKKFWTILLVLALMFSMSVNSFAAGNAKNEAKGKPEKEVNQQKLFKAELNAEKKIISQEKSALNAEKEAMLVDYENLIALGDLVAAEEVLVGINALDVQIQILQADMKRLINERFMVIKTEYSNEELATFENAAALIAKMYDDVTVLGLGAITIKNNIIKLDAPSYIKGGRTIIPVRTITEEFGAAVSYNIEDKTVTVSKDNIEIIFTIGSTKVLVDGVEQTLDVSTSITNGRTYVPLRFIAETFGLTVDWDAENNIIEIEEEPEALEEPEDPEELEMPEEELTEV